MRNVRNMPNMDDKLVKLQNRPKRACREHLPGCGVAPPSSGMVEPSAAPVPPLLPLQLQAAVPLRQTVERICLNNSTIDELHSHLQRGVNPDDDASGGTPLLIASYHGRADCVETLLSAGASPNFEGRTEVNLTNRGAAAALDRWMNGSVTPLYVAAQRGHAECVSMLVLAGANVNQAQDSDGATPLFASCTHGHVDCAARLLSAGSLVDQARWDGTTPLAMCCREGHVECARLLCSKGASVDVLTMDGGLSPMAEAFARAKQQPPELRVQVRGSAPSEHLPCCPAPARSTHRAPHTRRSSSTLQCACGRAPLLSALRPPQACLALLDPSRADTLEDRLAAASEREAALKAKVKELEARVRHASMSACLRSHTAPSPSPPPSVPRPPWQLRETPADGLLTPRTRAQVRPLPLPCPPRRFPPPSAAAATPSRAAFGLLPL